MLGPTPAGRSRSGGELAAYVIAANLIDLKTFEPSLDSDFRATIKALLTTPTIDGPDNLIECHERRPDKLGNALWRLAGRGCGVPGNLAELARVAKVFKGWLGDRASYSSFSFGNLWWQCDPSKPVGINRAVSTMEGHSIDGVLPEEQRRASCRGRRRVHMATTPRKTMRMADCRERLSRRSFCDVPVTTCSSGKIRLSCVRFAGYTLRRSSLPRVMIPGSHTINYYYSHVPVSFPAPIPSSSGKNFRWTTGLTLENLLSAFRAIRLSPLLRLFRPLRPRQNGATPQWPTRLSAVGEMLQGTSDCQESGNERCYNESFDRPTFLRFDLRSGASGASSAILRLHVSGLPTACLCPFARLA